MINISFISTDTVHPLEMPVEMNEAVLQKIAKAIEIIEKQHFSNPWTEGGIIASLENPNCHFVLCFCDGILQGYGSFNHVYDEGYINNFATDKTFLHQGVGSKILRKMLELACGFGLAFLSLEARISNSNAISLYQKYGFVSCGIRKDFYSSPKEDGIIMTKKFNQR